MVNKYLQEIGEVCNEEFRKIPQYLSYIKNTVFEVFVLYPAGLELSKKENTKRIKKSIESKF